MKEDASRLCFEQKEERLAKKLLRWSWLAQTQEWWLMGWCVSPSGKQKLLTRHFQNAWRRPVGTTGYQPSVFHWQVLQLLMLQLSVCTRVHWASISPGVAVRGQSPPHHATPRHATPCHGGTPGASFPSEATLLAHPLCFRNVYIVSTGVWLL